jgi:hypothetical protein
MSKSERIFEVITKFVYDTLAGQESGMYKAISSSDQSKLSILQTKTFQMTGISFIVSYFNDAYRSLITEEDKYFVERFKEMHDIMDHSYICLLNIVFNLTITFYCEMDRSKFNISNYKNYMNSFECELNKMKDTMFPIEKRKELFNHVCKGIDIKTCNPNEIFIKANPIY